MPAKRSLHYIRRAVLLAGLGLGLVWVAQGADRPISSRRPRTAPPAQTAPANVPKPPAAPAEAADPAPPADDSAHNPMDQPQTPASSPGDVTAPRDPAASSEQAPVPAPEEQAETSQTEPTEPQPKRIAVSPQGSLRPLRQAHTPTTAGSAAGLDEELLSDRPLPEGLFDSADAPSNDEPAGADPAPAEAPIAGKGADDETSPDDLLAVAPAVEIRPSNVDGLVPGVSTAADVEQRWGQPQTTAQKDKVVRYTYAEVEGFRRVVVVLEDSVVRAILMDLDDRLDLNRAVKGLDLANVLPAVVPDDSGRAIGYCYPERGVLLRLDRAGSTSVRQMIFEPISAEPFLLRAEQNVHQRYAQSLADLYQVIRREDSAYARWLRAKVLVEIGRLDAAQRDLELAMQPEPLAEHWLLLAKIEHRRGQFEAAMEAAEKAAQLSHKRPEVHARALLQLGDQLATGPQRDYRRAIEYHQQAIKTAEPLILADSAELRRAGLEILLDGNLHAAQDVARGPYRDKETAVNQWLQEAQRVADQLIEKEQGSLEYRLRVARYALAAYAGIHAPQKAEAFAETALRTGRLLLDECSDPLRAHYLEWAIGQAMYDALQIFHVQRQFPQAMRYGMQAVRYLEQSGADLDEPTQAYLMGRLYFRIGSVHAIGRQRHDEAVVWFDKSLPLLRRPIPPSAYGDIGSQGEAMVSMAISYWRAGRQDEALDLTVEGSRLMEQAVREGILSEEALHVPYSNLAVMHRSLGEHDRAAEYRAMADALRPGERPVRR